MSQEWYHGPITRQTALTLLDTEGDFLVRDCISNPGDYVLTCMAEGKKVLHFRLNKALVGQDWFFQFEGDLFPTIEDLINHHLTTGQPISNSSNAVISRPRSLTKCHSLVSSDRSQSSMSGDTASTVSSGAGSAGGGGGHHSLTKSGSRASLLKEKEAQCPPPSQLKRFKSLPAGKIRRTKRRAPSPPKSKQLNSDASMLMNEPTAAAAADNSTTTTTHQEEDKSIAEGGAMHSPTPSSSGEVKKAPSLLLEGVKLRRKKFSQIIPKPLSLRQRQSMHITAGLQDHLRKGLTEEKRRFSMPRLLDDSEEEESWDSSSVSTNFSSNLVRSPSDTSLIYLNQASFQAQQQQSLQEAPAATRNSKRPSPSLVPGDNRTPGHCIAVMKPRLPEKKRPRSKDPCQVQNSSSKLLPIQPSPPDVFGTVPTTNGGKAKDEAIYDCLPKPRSCLNEQQIKYNDIYDIPRRLLLPKDEVKEEYVDEQKVRSVSAFGSRFSRASNRRCHARKPDDAISVCSMKTAAAANFDTGAQRLNRRGNFDDGLNQGVEFRPALPPKSQNSRRPGDEDIYNVPKQLKRGKVIGNGGLAEDAISLCSNFSFCSDCTNTSTGLADDTLSSFSVTQYSEDATPFHFSPTSFLSENSLSLLDLNDGGEDLRPHHDTQCSHLKALSSVSSVSSITLQGDDISLGYDTTSLPEDPFPQGLPSSASSTIGSSASSRRSSLLSASSDTSRLNENDHSDAEPILPDDDDRVDIEATPPEMELCKLKSHSATNLVNNGDDCNKEEENEEKRVEEVTQTGSDGNEDELPATEEQPEEDEAEEEEAGRRSTLHGEEVPDIFNHRSSSRAFLRPCRSHKVRCKSQPQKGTTDSDPVWQTSNGMKEESRKSLSPSLLQSTSGEEGCFSPHQSPNYLVHGSIFDPSTYLTLFLPASGNKPLDPMALSAVHRTVVDTSAPILAIHLTQIDLWTFGLLPRRCSNVMEDDASGEEGGEGCSPGIKGNLWLLAEPFDSRFATDILERYLCLRTFVVVTILAASNITESARVLSKWIRVADELYKRLKNYFGYYCIASGLIGSPHLIGWNQLWSELQEVHPSEWDMMNGPVRAMLQQSLDVADVKPDATVPNVLPFVATKVSAPWAKGDRETEEALLANIIDVEQAAFKCAAMTDMFKKNAQMAFRHLGCPDDLLLDLFRTEFHIRLLWGTNGVANYPDNFHERHNKFAKVLSALSVICSRQI